MRKSYFVIALVVCAMATSAFGWGSLISSFRAPGGGTYPNGVGWHSTWSTNLFVNTNTPDRCYRTSFTGSIVRSHTSPTTSTMGSAAGVISGIGYYWVVSYNPRRIYRVGYNSGSVYGSFTAPGSYPYGAAFRQVGSTYYLYYTDMSGRRLYRMNATTGSVYASYALAFSPGDLGYGDGYLWIVDNSSRRLRKCSVTGSTYDSFSLSAYGYPSGCAYDSGRNQVWVGINAPLHSVLRFTAHSGTSVKPASVGKIKAMYQ
ncbi:MAG: hypothetical protein JSU81_09720 [Candidatus Coatesbacteria bacterium]|nr:MAG: hypothetical protein JSU81_09720 [Candidatus Coatesbacteria bacterium]